MNNVETYRERPCNDDSINSTSTNGHFQPGMSLMNVNSSVPGTSTLNLSRSVSSVGRSNMSINLPPGAECVTNTQTLPHSRPPLLPGMSIVDTDECHSAPVTMVNSSFISHFSDAPAPGASLMSVNRQSLTSVNSLSSSYNDDTRHRNLQPGVSILSAENCSSSLNMPGASLMNVNRPSLTSVNSLSSSYNDDTTHRNLQPGMSIMNTGNRGSSSNLSASPEPFMTALISPDTRHAQVKNTTLSSSGSEKGTPTKTVCRSHFRCTFL